MINFLYVPGNVPPQVEYDSARLVLYDIQENGLTTVAQRALNILQEDHEPFGVYLDEFGYDLNERAEAPWADRTLKFGAALAIEAYKKSGIYTLINDDAFAVGHFVAEMTGIPDAYEAALPEDPTLFTLVKEAAGDKLFDESDLVPKFKGGYEQIFNLGAGCARHYLQQALAS